MHSIFDYTLRSLTRFGLKNISIVFIFSLLVWLLSSVIFITSSLQKEFQEVIEATPELVVNRQIAGRYGFLESNDIEPFWEIPGVSYVKGRVWGQYFLELHSTYLTLVGLEPFEEHYMDEITKIAEILPLNEDEKYSYMYTSKNLYNLLSTHRSSDDIIYFEKLKGGHEELKMAGFFHAQSSLLSNDVVLMSNESVRRILGLKQNKFTDAIIKVSNPDEAPFIAAKIANLYPELKVTSKEEISKDYALLYQFKSGWFLMVFVIAFVVFAIILYDKATGLRSEERREIGVLKAIGWEINHIIYHKLLESIILSFGAFLLGVMAALMYVYIFQAPLLKYIFTGYSELKQPFHLTFALDIKMVAMLFFSTVPFFIGVSIIPSWKAASEDVGEILR